MNSTVALKICAFDGSAVGCLCTALTGTPLLFASAAAAFNVCFFLHVRLLNAHFCQRAPKAPMRTRDQVAVQSAKKTTPMAIQRMYM